MAGGNLPPAGNTCGRHSGLPAVSSAIAPGGTFQAVAFNFARAFLP